MDYEKKYKEALERAKKLYKDAITLQLEQDIKDYEYIFPELKESEDEIMRMALVKYFDDMRKDGICANGIHPSDIIEWLKRQKRDGNILS